MQKWVSVWGNAVSIAENRPERYAKDITLRYPIVLPFSGSGVRLTFDNYCGTEPVTLEKVTIFCGGAFHPVTFGGEHRVTLPAEGNAISDTLETPVTAGEKLLVSFYLRDFTLMRSVVFTCGALSGGLYANGDETENLNISMDTSRKTQLTYFLSNVSVRTAPENRAIICYGDSITAQDWPDDLQLRCRKDGFEHTAIIRRATSGSRILREYHCLTYESYGLMGAKRFAHEVPTDGADAVIIQQGINDIIHPVGTQVNPFRPMSDLPTADELISGLKTYITQARGMGLRVYVGTLLPMGGWRTDAPFRQDLRHAYNDFIRTTNLIDGCIDFDRALRDPANPDFFLPEYDSGDHLHPSKAGYQRMAAEVPADMVLVSVVGIAGLQSVMDALGANRQVLLANKEALVTGGHLVMDAAKRIGKPILPVDSEHSAIFQCLQGAGGNQPVRLLLTASGGPFRTWTREQMQNATRAQALKHPNWSMGAKITIDSASMFNKALEIIEAHWLFDMPPEKIQVVVHPQSIVHSAVEFADGAVLAQLGVPDMRVPIAYAMTYPRRIPTGSKPLDLFSIGTLTFEPGDPVRFPALRLAGECLNAGGAACTILNGANEMAVAAFLRDEIPFGAISRIVEGTLEACGAMPADTLEDIFHADLEARRVAKETAEKLK